MSLMIILPPYCIEYKWWIRLNRYQNKIMLRLISILLTLSICLAFRPCQPFGPRVFYGDTIQDPSSSTKLMIYFNTAQECSRSYVQLVRKSGMAKVPCSIETLSLSKNTNHYQTTLHRCSTDIIDWQEFFHYNMFGWDGSSDPIVYGDFIPLRLANPFNKDRQMNLIVLADWSKIKQNLYKYTPIDTLLRQVQEKEQINGIVINGDIGYDLDTNNCSNYQDFLVMLANTSASLPIIMITGNHEYNTQDNWKLFSKSFQMYGLDQKLVVGLSMGAIYLVNFDPFDLLYNNSRSKDDNDPVFQELDKILTKVKDNGQFVIPISHYPLVCSGGSSFCTKCRTMMKDYWMSMLRNGVSLYIGAHYHTYQRIFPYNPNDTFTHQQGDYYSDGGYLVSIVEGVAGNDKDIVESLDSIKKYTAAYTVNDTGFGILQVSMSTARYRHLSTKKGEVDMMNILIRPKERGQLTTE